MIVLNQKPLSMAELKDHIKNIEEKKNLEDYLKAFTKLKKDKAEALAKDIHALNNPKIKEEQVIKVVDFLPKTQEEVNKIFIDATLSEEEANAVVEIVKKY
ncbi:hypothetical protein J4408_03680 [Candidatus Pacearchaeota archaeon]|nr:hypothetical protein [Candidatus Pacearchaeota archaeon]